MVDSNGAQITFTCPSCAAVSHNPMHVAEGYCGMCHQFKEETLLVLSLTPPEAAALIRQILASVREGSALDPVLIPVFERMLAQAEGTLRDASSFRQTLRMVE